MMSVADARAMGLPLPVTGEGLSAGARARAARRLRNGDWTSVVEPVAEELPVALQYNGISHAVMLATPCDLEDFAVGFSLTEGIVESISEVRDLEIEAVDRGFVVALSIAPGRFEALKLRRRSLVGRTGCGLCGVESIDQALIAIPPLEEAARGLQFDPAAVLAAMQALRTRQPLHDETGATHAAGFADVEGRLVCVREDVGRHNALDKLIGALARGGIAAERGMAVVTSRASHEMAAKTARAGIPLLAAVSGGTHLAALTSDEAGLCLAGFVRGADLTLYSHPERIRSDDGC
jgi:FdhD protein